MSTLELVVLLSMPSISVLGMAIVVSRSEKRITYAQDIIASQRVELHELTILSRKVVGLFEWMDLSSFDSQLEFVIPPVITVFKCDYQELAQAMEHLKQNPYVKFQPVGEPEPTPENTAAGGL